VSDRREYKVALAQTEREAPTFNGNIERNAERTLNEWGAEGYRLVRAEADAQGVMWLIAERTIKGE
jgi:hypothetical protein